MPETQKEQGWAVLPYNSQRINGRYLVSNFLGSWNILTPDEFKKLELIDIEIGDEFHKRLYDKGIVVDEKNFSKIIFDYQKLNANLFLDTSLHIAVLTTRCNIACTYCQTRVDNPSDMDTQTAAKVLNYCFAMRNPNVHLEFQGGGGAAEVGRYTVYGRCR